jgi:beta-glucosidase
MQNSSINLKDNDIQVDSEDVLGVAAETKEEHKKRFEDRMKKIENLNSEKLTESVEVVIEKSVDPLSIDFEKSPNPLTQATDKAIETINPLDQAKDETIKQAPDKIIEKIQAVPLVTVRIEKVETAVAQNAINAGEKLNFPEGFLWGTSTSAYQVEGDNVNDWSEWEKEGKRMLKLMKKKNNPDDFICGTACDSYNRYEEDLDLANKLNNNTIRFGMEWSRVEQKKDIWNVDEIKHYREMLRAAKQKGFKTVFTLWHWTLPTWLANSGGLVSKDFEKRFTRYVEMVIGELGGDIDYWVTLNEPMIAALNAYISKRWPPNKRNIFKYRRAVKNLVKVHKLSYKMIHERFPDARVGYSNLTNYIEPKHKWLITDILIAKLFDLMWNKWFINKTIDHVDYIGMSYYFHDRIVSYPPFVKNANKQKTDMGWEIYPEGIYHVLKQLAKYDKPIMILENGLADEQDKYRADFIKDHLRYVHQAISEGVEVLGYFHWSLLDNFEWDLGYAPKFGLYAVDRKTFVRTARPSAAVYAKICGENGVEA